MESLLTHAEFCSDDVHVDSVNASHVLDLHEKVYN